MVKSPYPVPGPIGGRLIREVIRSLRRECGLDLPLSSDVFLAVSGGSDSVALALLLARYGRRVLPRDRLRVLHLNHGWRGQASDSDEAWVREFARGLKVECQAVRLPGPESRPKRESWEEFARRLRAAEYARLRRLGAWVMTAHHADDRVETLLWRFLTGSFSGHEQGIWARTETGLLRPCLNLTKAELRGFLEEEKQVWREDATNSNGRFLRSQMRQELVPVLERLFPGYRDSLLRYAHGVGKSEALARRKWSRRSERSSR